MIELDVRDIHKLGTATPYAIPRDDDFGDRDYLPADDLHGIVADLLARHDATFAHIRPLRLALLWKRQGGLKGGREVLGKCQAVSGLARHFGDTDYAIWLAADHSRKARLSERQVEALLYHELRHLGTDPDTGAVKLVGHEFEGFLGELAHYGAWDADLAAAREAFRQLPLPGE